VTRSAAVRAGLPRRLALAGRITGSQPCTTNLGGKFLPRRYNGALAMHGNELRKNRQPAGLDILERAVTTTAPGPGRGEHSPSAAGPQDSSVIRQTCKLAGRSWRREVPAFPVSPVVVEPGNRGSSGSAEPLAPVGTPARTDA
jgi:hypothetical protein